MFDSVISTNITFLHSQVNTNTESTINELWHEISNDEVCATSKSSDQPAHTRSLIRAYASRLHVL